MAACGFQGLRLLWGRFQPKVQGFHLDLKPRRPRVSKVVPRCKPGKNPA